MATCGTFDYTFVVPDGPPSGDRELIAMLPAGHVLDISRTHCAALGLSVLRGEDLAGPARDATRIER